MKAATYVLVGRMPGCRHAVAIDCDTSNKARAAMARSGLDVETMEFGVGNQAFNDEVTTHFATCANAKK